MKLVRLKATVYRLIAVRSGPPALVDVAVAIAVLVGSLAIMSHGVDLTGAHSQLGLLRVALAAAASLPLLAVRRTPFGVFVVTAAATALASGVNYPLDNPIPLGSTVALYMLAASRDRVHPWTPRITGGVVGLFLVYLAATAAAEGKFPAIELLHTGLAWTVAWFAGDRARLFREQMAELGERAVQAKREAERDRRLAVAEERARIARDVHDSVGHAINVIAIRAGAARLRHDQDPSRSRVALEAIEEVARQTAEDIDHIVHAFRDDSSVDGTPVAPPGLASLDTLLDHHSNAGLDVTLRRSGSCRPLAHASDQAAYRIIQEALTNAARHGAGTAVVELAFEDAALQLTVTNPLVRDDALRPTRGHGLIGMHERAALIGGTLEAGAANGAFHVRARIPYAG